MTDDELRNLSKKFERLQSSGASECRLTRDDFGWIDGLSKDGDMVAHLDLEDSQMAPLLWEYALLASKDGHDLAAEVLRLREALRDITGTPGRRWHRGRARDALAGRDDT